MSQREWVQFVKDAKIPIPITEINDVFRRVDSCAAYLDGELAEGLGSLQMAQERASLEELLELMHGTVSADGVKALHDGAM